MQIDTYQKHGLDRPFGADDFRGHSVNGRSNFDVRDSFGVPGDRQYHPCPEAYPSDRVPKGRPMEFRDRAQSSIFPDTQRDMWIYVPQQREHADGRPYLVVFDDGAMYLDPEGPVRVCNVLDTMHSNEDIRPTIGVFVTPGRPFDVPIDANLMEEPRYTKQRHDEYCELTDTYGLFLLREVIPFVEDQIGMPLSDDSTKRTICGFSSGGICAFNAAWHFPESFCCVLSHCGSFISIRGGHNYPYLVRSTTRKPIKVYLQSGERDADIVNGNIPLANRQMAAALT